MIRPVLELPHPVLAAPAEPLGAVDDRARALGADLLDTMRASPHSVGLAAPQLGIGRRACCLDVTGHPKATSCHGELVLFDPVVVEAGAPEIGREGCMSVPHLTGDVARATRLVVRALDLDGARRELHLDGFEARVLQHELDHLDGLLFLDRVVAHDRVFRRRVYR
ncbi:MAG: peptide deformylase [Acidimicrobiia bacterium]